MIFNLKTFETFDDSKIREAVYKNDKLIRYPLFIIGIFIQALSFNLFILPCNIIFGVSGISIILYNVFNITPSLIILLANVLLIIASFVFLGKQTAKGAILGSFLFPLFVQLTSSVPNYIDLGATEFVVMAVAGAILNGIGTGIVFKEGFTAGGSDILKRILSEYGKMPVGKAMIYVEGVIITCGLFVIGWQTFIYSILVIAIMSFMTDRVIIGISQFKTFQIITTKDREVEQFLLNQLHHGVTALEGRGAYTEKKHKVLLCTLPTKEYFLAKKGILLIDPQAFFVVTDAYEVRGGE